MRLSRPFIKLPWNFPAAEIAAEIDRIPPEAWTAHPSRLNGNSAVALVSRQGRENDDFDGAMQATPFSGEAHI